MNLIDRLKRYNTWRRGEDESLEQPNPTQLGKDIDEAIERLAAADRLVETMKNKMKYFGCWSLELEEEYTAYQARSEKLQIPLSQRILNELKHQASAPHEYVNPHFLRKITSALEKYYNIEDQNVDSWIKDMFDV